MSVVLFFICLFGSKTIADGLKLVIDHDAGSDDAMAIFMALLHEKYFNGLEVIALTTTHGNVNESTVFVNTQKILTVANRSDVPIYRGCNSSLVYTQPTDNYFGLDGLGNSEVIKYVPIEAQPEHAVLALIDLSKKYEGELIVLALGALTNIAMAVKLDDGFLTRLSQLYAAAGSVHGPDYPLPQYNANADVEAYEVVMKNARSDKVTLISSSQMLLVFNISREWRQNALGAIPTAIMRAQNIFERVSITVNDHWHLLDPAAFAVIVDESLVVDIKYSKNNIILCGENRGLTTNNFTDPYNANVKLLYASLGDPYKNLLMKIFSAELNTF